MSYSNSPRLPPHAEIRNPQSAIRKSPRLPEHSDIRNPQSAIRNSPTLPEHSDIRNSQFAIRNSLSLLYVDYEGITGAVFDSQVLSYLLGLRRRGIAVSLMAFDPWEQVRRPGYREKQEQVRGRLDGAARFGTRLPVLGRATLNIDARRLARRVRDWFAANAAHGVIHCRNAWASYLALTARGACASRVPVIADIRGAAAAEFELYGARSRRTAWRVRAMQRVEPFVCRHAAHIVCVSTPLRDNLRRAYGLPADKITVVPTCVDTSAFHFDPQRRAARRQELGLSDRVVVLYCGSLQGWQNPSGMVAAFQALVQQEPRAHFLALTPDIDAMTATLRAAGVASTAATVRRVEHAQVPGYIMCGDIALLVRDVDAVNAVASPTKFAEYLACGVPVLVSPGIGDTQAVVERHGCGLVYRAGTETAPFLRRVTQEREALAGACRRAATECYELETHLDRLMAIYTRVAGGPADYPGEGTSP